MNRVVIIGDIVASKQIENRNEVQENLNQVLSHLNYPHRNDLLSNYTITIGDEFQVVLSEFDSVFSDIINISVNLYPVKVRFAIGIGTLSTPINEEQAIGMDGPAFYLARHGIEGLKKTGSLFRIDWRYSDTYYGITMMKRNIS